MTLLRIPAVYMRGGTSKALVFTATRNPRSTVITWSTRTDGSAADAPFRLAVLDGVKHVYPNGTNNPHGFSAADRFWQFFLRNGCGS